MKQKGAEILQQAEEALKQVAAFEDSASIDFLALLASSQTQFRDLTIKSQYLHEKYRLAHAEVCFRAIVSKFL